MGVRPREIHVKIGELILHGVTPEAALGIGETAERELSRLLAEQGVPTRLVRSGTLDRVDAGAFARGATASPTEIGGDIARAVYGGISR
jgi:hypothetical protein